MKKNRLGILIAFMALSLIGIVIVQIVWIRNALNIRNEQFDASVQRIMNESVDKLETFDYISAFTGIDIPPPPPPPPHLEPNIEKFDSIIRVFELSIMDSSKKDIQSEIRKPQIISYNGNRITINSFNHDSLKNYSSNSKGILESNVTINFDTLITGHKSATNEHLPHTYEHTIELNGNDASNIIIERIKGKEQKINWVARKMVDEILINKDILRKIPFEELCALVQQGLKENNIETDVQLALLKNNRITNSSDSIIDSTSYLLSDYRTRLYPNDIISKDVFISAVFPTKQSYLFTSMLGLLLASLIFSLLIFTAFWMSIHLILKQKKLSEVKSDFINNMTHEFKTPIATIAVALDTLINENVISNTDKIKEYAGIIKTENQRMNGHVEKILGLARMERELTEYNFEPLNVHQMLEDLCDSFSLKVASRMGQITHHLNAKNPFIIADASHLYNALQNIIDNAEKYSPEAPQIVIASFEENQHLVISVSDSGVGMTKQVQARIFDTFYRQTSGNIHNVKGFGLGLSYVKTVIECHQGQVAVSSRPGKGSEFKIYLPYTHEQKT